MNEKVNSNTTIKEMGDFEQIRSTGHDRTAWSHISEELAEQQKQEPHVAFVP